jgi:hypothetical protein
MEAIAIIGFAFKLPGSADDVDSFWGMLQAGRNTMTEWPESRLKVDAFHDPDLSKKNVVGCSEYQFMIDGALSGTRSTPEELISSTMIQDYSMHLSSRSQPGKQQQWIRSNG